MNATGISEDSANHLPMPSSAICCAKDLGSGRSIECLVVSPDKCAYAVHFGSRFLCRHPDGLAIATQSRKGHNVQQDAVDG